MKDLVLLLPLAVAAQQKEAALDQRFQALYVMRQLKETGKSVKPFICEDFLNFCCLNSES